MKILFLNVWGGRLWDDLTSFLEKHVEDTDLFCLEEVTSAPVHRNLEALGMAGNPCVKV
jgi:hypothetical protein